MGILYTNQPNKAEYFFSNQATLSILGATKLLIVSMNRTRTIVNSSQWKWALIHDFRQTLADFLWTLAETQGNYNKKIAPFSFDKVSNINIPVNINVSMSVIDIIKIAEVDHNYVLKFRLVLEW